jgi:hypothetical protein
VALSPHRATKLLHGLLYCSEVLPGQLAGDVVATVDSVDPRFYACGTEGSEVVEQRSGNAGFCPEPDDHLDGRDLRFLDAACSCDGGEVVATLTGSGGVSEIA